MFGERLKQLRKDKKITQKKLADILNIDRTSIGKYETKNVIPGPDLLIKIADFFNVSLDYLLGRPMSSARQNVYPLAPEMELVFKKFNALSPAQQQAIKILLGVTPYGERTNKTYEA